MGKAMNIKTLILFSILLTSGVFSQSFYLKLQSGYGIGTSSQNVTGYNYTSTGTSSTITQTSKSYSFGKGLYFGGTFGYVISPNIDLNLDLQYLSGLATSYSNSDTYSSSAAPEKHDYELSGHAFMLIPSILLKADIGFLKSYIKAGPIFSIAGVTNKSDSYAFLPSALDPDLRNSKMHLTVSEYKYDGGMAFGFNAAVGFSKEISGNTELFFEVNSKSISYAPVKGEMTKYTIDGYDNLPKLSVFDKQIEFSETGVDNYSAPKDQNKPAQKLKSDLPFSSLIFSLGISFKF